MVYIGSSGNQHPGQILGQETDQDKGITEIGTASPDMPEVISTFQLVSSGLCEAEQAVRKRSQSTVPDHGIPEAEDTVPFCKSCRDVFL